MKTRSKPSAYHPLPFHAIRALSFVSALIVFGILGFFMYQLKHDGYKLPWTFLITFAAATLSLIVLLLTFIVHCCAHLSPLFSVILNIPLLLLWTTGMVLLIWNMYGTLGHSCNKVNWASSDGMMICRTYKALFSFVVVGWLAQVALVVLDVRARRTQTALGAYNKMAAEKDMKMDELNKEPRTGAHEVPYGIDDYQDRGSAVHQRMRSVYDNGQGSMRMHDFEYQIPSQQISYNSASYGHHDRR